MWTNLNKTLAKCDISDEEKNRTRRNVFGQSLRRDTPREFPHQIKELKKDEEKSRMRRIFFEQSLRDTPRKFAHQIKEIKKDEEKNRMRRKLFEQSLFKRSHSMPNLEHQIKESKKSSVTISEQHQCIENDNDKTDIHLLPLAEEIVKNQRNENESDRTDTHLLPLEVGKNDSISALPVEALPQKHESSSYSSEKGIHKAEMTVKVHEEKNDTGIRDTQNTSNECTASKNTTMERTASETTTLGATLNSPPFMSHIQTLLNEVENFWEVHTPSTQSVAKRIATVEKHVFQKVQQGGIKNRLLVLLYFDVKDRTKWSEWIEKLEMLWFDEVRHGPIHNRMESLEEFTEGKVQVGSLYDRLVAMGNSNDM